MQQYIMNRPDPTADQTTTYDDKKVDSKRPSNGTPNRAGHTISKLHIINKIDILFINYYYSIYQIHIRWSDQMVRSDGPIRWSDQMVRSDGPIG